MNRESLDFVLSEPQLGRAMVIVVGGANEALYAVPGEHCLTLRNRKGFICLALRHGSVSAHPWLSSMVRTLQCLWGATFYPYTQAVVKMVEQKNVQSPSPARTPKLQLSAEQPLTGECWIPRKKDTPHPRAKEKPSRDGRSAIIAFRIKPHIHQRCSEGSNNTLCTIAPRESTEAKPDLPLCRVTPAEVWVSSGLPQGQGLWVQ